MLEIFGGSGLSTVAIAKVLCSPDNLTSVDLNYSNPLANFQALAVEHGLTYRHPPTFIVADAKRLPFASSTFDYVIAPDSPRTRFETTGQEWGLSIGEQKSLFVQASHEALRVLKCGGVYAATTPASWCREIGATIIAAPSDRLSFCECHDPIVYCRLVKT